MSHETSNTEWSALRSWAKKMGGWTPTALVILTSAAGCGVQDHPQGESDTDASSDFVPVGHDAASTPPTPDAPGVTPEDHESPPPVSPDAALDASPPVDTQDAAPPPVVDAAPANDPFTITLGGTDLHKEDVIAFIHLGHSNMAGRALDPTATRPFFFTDKDPHAWMYHVGKMPELAYEPKTAGDGDPSNGAGPGTALVKEAAALAPGKYFMSLGYGQGSAYCSQFLPGALYYDLVMAAPKAIKGKVTFGAIVIMLGVTERHGTAADITGYPECINKLVTAIRTDLDEPNLPLLLTGYEMNGTGQFAPDQPFPKSIIPQILRVPSVVANSALVPADGIPMQDDHHFNLDGHKLWVSRLFQIMKDKKWSPWAP